MVTSLSRRMEVSFSLPWRLSTERIIITSERPEKELDRESTPNKAMFFMLLSMTMFSVSMPRAPSSLAMDVVVRPAKMLVDTYTKPLPQRMNTRQKNTAMPRSTALLRRFFFRFLYSFEEE